MAASPRPTFWTDQDADTLNAFLMRDDAPDNTMDASMIDGLAEMAHKVHAYWLQRRLDEEASGIHTELLRRPATYVRSEPKLGRNDPCHCGSGRKYKHCHGAN